MEEIKKLIKVLESKCRDLEYLKGQVEENLESIEKLEERVQGTEEEVMGHLVDEHFVLIRKPKKNESPAHDKHRKPGGGLKPGDVISLEGDGGKKDFGIYHSTEKTETMTKTWAYWQIGKKCFLKKLSFTQYPVTFEFRPNPKEV